MVADTNSQARQFHDVDATVNTITHHLSDVDLEQLTSDQTTDKEC